MDVGVTASFDFTGSPPFKLDYTEQRKGGRAKFLSQTFQSHHGSIVLRPEQEGVYTYVGTSSSGGLRKANGLIKTFTTLSDRKYKKVAVDKEPIQQTVHPLANVEIVENFRRRTLYSCSGDVVDIDIDARVSSLSSRTSENDLWRVTGHRTSQTHISRLLLNPLVQYHPSSFPWPIAPFHPRPICTLIHLWCFG